MTFAYLLPRYNFPPFIIPYMKQCVSPICLQLILLPLCLALILVPPNVYTSIVPPLLPLTIPYPFFVYLYWILLPSWHISLWFLRVYILSPSVAIEVSEVAALCRPPILHISEWIAISIYASKRAVVKFTIGKHS